ncbi:LamG domain-containing protein [bacterium]|nr:LamG domain-containing protein [bacterium]
MSVGYNPKTITDSILFNLDAANIRSYYNDTNNYFPPTGTAANGTDTSIAFPITGNGSFKRVGYGQTYGGYTIQQSDDVYRYDFLTNGCNYHGYSISVPKGYQLKFTYDYYVDSSTSSDYPLNTMLSGVEVSGQYGVYQYAPNSNKGVWQTISALAPKTTAATQANILLYPGNCGNTRMATSGFILYKNVRLKLIKSDFDDSTEKLLISPYMYNETPYSTDGGGCFDFSTATGANAAASTLGFGINTIPVPAMSNFTFSVWIKNPPNIGQSGLFSFGGTDGFRFGINPGSVYWLIGPTYAEGYVGFLSSLNSSKWYNVVASYDRNGSLNNGTPNVTVYLNGVYQGRTNTSATQTPMTLNQLGGIVHSACCTVWTGKLATFTAYGKSLTESEALTIFNSTKSRFGL